MQKFVQEFVWSTKDDSNYEIESSVYIDYSKLDDRNSLLVLKEHPFYPRIDITGQFKSSGELWIMKDSVMTRVIKNLAQKANKELNIELIEKRLGIKDKNK